MTINNSTKNRAYYQQTKQDPERHAALKARRSRNQRVRRAALKEHVKQENPEISLESLLRFILEVQS